MATTPNYGWVMPSPTDLVTNLPADFEIFGDAVDATLEAIETKLDVITTEGDLVVGDASGDPVRVPVGTAGQILASDGDTVEWISPSAGSLTLLSTTALTGATVTLSGISQAFNFLYLEVRNYRNTTNSVNRVGLNGAFNNVGMARIQQRANVISTLGVAGSFINLGDTGAGITHSASIFIYDYTIATSRKKVELIYSYTDPTGNDIQGFGGGGTTINTAITSIALSPTSGTFNNGEVLLYGGN